MNCSVRLKLFLSHIFAVLLVSGSIGTFFYANAFNALQDGLKERLKSSAALISQTMDSDRLHAIRTEADMTNPAYQAVVQRLRSLRRMNPDIAFLYIMRQEGPHVLFVADSDESEAQALPGKKYAPSKSNPALIRGFTGVSVDDALTQDEWGTYLSGYAPLKNGRGEYLVGIDMHADYVQEKYHNLRLSGALSLFASIALAALFAHYLAARFMVRIDVAIARCTAIAAGKLNEMVVVSSNDELDKLLVAVNEMSAALAQAQEKKREAFEELRRSRDELEVRVMQRTQDLTEMNDKLNYEIAQRVIAQNALHEAASTDHLTRLLNRRAMLEKLDHEFTRSRRTLNSFTVLLADLDHFKTINDSKGHDAGDSVLMEVSIRIRTMLRGEDSVARWGGEEFLILLPETDASQALVVAEKIRSRIVDTPFYVDGEAITLSVSLGLAQHHADLDIPQLIKHVDEALYRAKEQGRNQVVSWQG